MSSTKNRVASVACAAIAWMGCGGDVTLEGGAGPGGNGAGGGSAGGSSVDCSLDGPGAPFTFVVRNTGTRQLRLTYGCGTDYPITLTTPDGDLGIGPGNADGCEVSCDSIYAGQSSFGCSDCGPGSGDLLPPGGEVTIDWDRRTYVAFTAPAECSGHPENNSCALGSQLANGTYPGALAVCNDQDMFGAGYCSDTSLELVPFNLDLSASTLEILVQ